MKRLKGLLSLVAASRAYVQVGLYVSYPGRALEYWANYIVKKLEQTYPSMPHAPCAVITRLPIDYFITTFYEENDDVDSIEC